MNELYELAKSLENSGIDLREDYWHHSIKNCPKNGKLIQVILNEDGTAKEYLNPDSHNTFKYYFPNARTQFPNIKFKSVENADTLENILNSVNYNNLKLGLNGLKELLNSFNISSGNLYRLVTVVEKTDIKNLYSSILTYIYNNKLADFTKDFYIYIDLVDAGDGYCSNINSWNEINSLLSNSTASSDSTELDYFGNPIDGWDEKGFQININKIGLFYPYSRNEDVGLYSKYGMNGPEACKVGSFSRNIISSGIQFITREEYFDKNWTSLNDGDKYLILSYKDNSIEEEVFNPIILQNNLTSTEDLFKAIQGSGTVNDNYNIVIYKCPKGSASIVFNQKSSVSFVKKSAEDWMLGMKNIPDSMIEKTEYLLKESKNKKYIEGLPTIKKFYSLINREIIYNFKKENNIVKYCSIADIYKFFFNNKQHINKIAKVFSQNHIKALIKYKMCKLEEHSKYEGYVNDVYSYFCMAGIILNKLESKKENYMKEQGYYLGQLLQVCDRLDKEYRKSKDKEKFYVTKGMVAFQNIYNNPIRTISNLLSEMKFHVSWAQSNKNDLYNQYKEILTKIDLNLIQNRSLSDKEKIQLAIGYVDNLPNIVYNDEHKDATSKEEQLT